MAIGQNYYGVANCVPAAKLWLDSRPMACAPQVAPPPAQPAQLTRLEDALGRIDHTNQRLRSALLRIDQLRERLLGVSDPASQTTACPAPMSLIGKINYATGETSDMLSALLSKLESLETL